ncbi:hypothetical protein [Collinsella aerofaciens]|uniref:hypothetical protein n=1 Tax=Collinsella aerofaciens TaxID=74426 RepID=UPI0022DF0AED|nr:hypothetical protein [Collinsella aerofaciens]
MLTSNLVPCFVQTFKTDSKTGYEKALLVGVFDKTTTDLDCCISSSSRDTGKTRQPVAVVMQEDGRLREVNVSNVIINDSYEVFGMYSWTFNENDITEQLGFQRKEDEQDPFIPGKRMVDGYFHCSDCGWDGQIWEHIGFGDMLAYEAVHCPKCGAIIERRA